MLVKIQDYFYHNNMDKENEKYNAPVLDVKVRDEKLKPHLIHILDKEELAPFFGVPAYMLEPIIELEGIPKVITGIFETPDSLYGEKTTGLTTTFPFEVGRIKNNFSQTFQADVKWEKMAMSKIIKKQNLRGKYIEIPNNYIYKFLKVEDVKPVPKELYFPVKDHILYWDIEADSRQVNHDIKYEDYKRMPVISIADFDNYKQEWHIFLWHPDFIEKETRHYDKLYIRSQDLTLENVYIHEVLTEGDVLEEFFSYFGKNKFDIMFGFWSTGGIMKQSFKGSTRREWRDGFDIQCVYARTEELGLIEEMQKMSMCPVLKRHWGNAYEGVYLRQRGDKHQVIIKGVGQIDFLVSNDVLNFAQKEYNFRGHSLADWMEYFLDYKKLDKEGKQVWQYWLQEDLTPEELDEGEIINGVPRVEGKGLDFMIKYNFVDVYGVVKLDERFGVSDKQANRTDVSISPFEDALHTSKLHDHYKLTHFQDKYMFDTKYQNKIERIIDGKKQIGDKFTITLEELERQANSRGKDVEYKSLDNLHKVGGFVPKPIERGIYEDVIVIDFSKFYPNMIKTCNIGVVSAINVDHYDDEYVWDKDGKQWKRTELIETPLSFFRKDIKSINCELFDDWMEKRVKAQKELGRYLEVHKTTKTDRYNFLWTEQFNIKNFMNGGFGVLGLPIDRIYWKRGFNNTTVSCYSNDTEILTKEDGWILFKNLKKEHNIACLGKNKHNFYWHKPSAIQKYYHKGKMIRIKQKSVDLLVTPDHKIHYITDNYKRNTMLKEFKFLPKVVKFLNKTNWEGEEKEWFYLPEIDSYKNIAKNIDKIKMDDFLEFLGWYIAEGYTTERSYEVGVCQKKMKNVKKIENLLNKLKFHYNYNNDRFVIYSKQLYTYLSKLGKAPDKYIPKEFMNLSKRQLKILFDALIKGDGIVRTDGRKKEQIIYYTTSKKLADQVQEIIIKLGYNASIKKEIPKDRTYKGKLIKSNYPMFKIIRRVSVSHNLSKKDHFREQNYSGFVYCCTVPEHVILVRRNGKPSWCGNCQDVIMFCMSLLHEWNYIILGGDTDSTFIKGIGNNLEELIEFGKNVCERLNKEIKKYMQNVYNVAPGDNYIKIGMETISDKFYVDCYSSDTEILTKNRSWVLFSDLTMEDEVACLSPDTHTMYWHKPLDLISYKYEGEMYKLKTRSLDLLVTPNHKLYIKENYRSKYRLEEIKNCKKSGYNVINSVDWVGEEKEWFYPPKVKCRSDAKNTFDRIKMDNWLEFLGWYIAEGNLFGKRGRDNRIRISQTKEKNIKIILNMLERICIDYTYKTNHSFTFSSKQICSYLVKLGRSYEKYIPQEFMNLSKRQLKILFDALIKGDGHIGGDGQIFYYSSSKRLVDQIQEIIMKLGYASSITTTKINNKVSYINNQRIISKRNMYRIHVRSNKRSYFGQNHVSTQYYSGFVYCCTVPEHIVLVRRNNKIVWCGNSKKHYIKRNVYVDGVILDKPELEIKGMDLKKRATSQLGADNQLSLINAIFEEKEPFDVIKEYICDTDYKLKDMDWTYVCKRGALNKDLSMYPPSNQSATGARNMLRLFGKYYQAGSNPFIGVFNKYPPEVNGNFLNGKNDFVLSFDEEDVKKLKEMGFELNIDVIRDTQCASKTDSILSLFGEDWYSLVELGNSGEMMLI